MSNFKSAISEPEGRSLRTQVGMELEVTIPIALRCFWGPKSIEVFAPFCSPNLRCFWGMQRLPSHHRQRFPKSEPELLDCNLPRAVVIYFIFRKDCKQWEEGLQRARCAVETACLENGFLELSLDGEPRIFLQPLRYESIQLWDISTGRC